MYLVQNFFILSILLFLTACGGGGGSDNNPAKTSSNLKYSIQEHNLPVYVQNKPSSQYKLEQMDDSSFNTLSKQEQYLVADKLLTTLFFGYPQKVLEQRIATGTFISDIRKQLSVSTNNMDEVEANIHDPERYYSSDSRPEVTILSRFFEMKDLDKNYFNHWMSYILTQTILFSPATELNTVSEPDTYGVYNRIYTLLNTEIGLRYGTFIHMQSSENWRRFRTPEDNGREMLEIYAMDSNDADVPLAAKALKNWHLSKDGDTLVVGLNQNSEVMSIAPDMQFANGVDFYASLAHSKAFIQGVTTRLVDFMFTDTSKPKKAQIIAKIVASNPEAWSDILEQIVFSKEYLLHTSRAKSIEENTFSLMKKFSYNAYYYTFLTLDQQMIKMNQSSMKYKLGKLTRVPLDDASFGTYQNYLKNEIFRQRSYDTDLSVNPNDINATYNSEYFMSDFKSYYRRGISTLNFMSSDNYEVIEDDAVQTNKNFINFVFNTVVDRDATPAEMKMLSDFFSKTYYANNLVYTNDDPAYQQYIRYYYTGTMTYVVLEYISRLDELYFFKEVK